MSAHASEAISRIRAVATSYGVALDEGQAETLVAYTAAVVERSKTVNLTAARTLRDAIEILLYPSMAALMLDDVMADAPQDGPAPAIVDIGSGNGFPGIVAAVAWPDAAVHLVERRGRKAQGIQDALTAAGVTTARALPVDARELGAAAPDLMGATRLVLARAVGPLAAVCRLGAPLLAPGGALAQWKASDLADHEAEEGARVARARGLTIRELLPDGVDAPSPGRLVVYTRPETP